MVLVLLLLLLPLLQTETHPVIDRADPLRRPPSDLIRNLGLKGGD